MIACYKIKDRSESQVCSSDIWVFALDDKKQNAKEKGMTKLEFLNTVLP